MTQQPWYTTTHSVKGSLIFLEDLDNPAFGETVTIRDGNTEMQGQVLETTQDTAVIQVFGKTLGLSRDAEVQFSGSAPTVKVSEDMLGKTFNGLGEPMQETQAYQADQERSNNG